MPKQKRNDCFFDPGLNSGGCNWATLFFALRQVNPVNSPARLKANIYIQNTILSRREKNSCKMCRRIFLLFVFLLSNPRFLTVPLFYEKNSLWRNYARFGSAMIFQKLLPCEKGVRLSAQIVLPDEGENE